MMTLSEGSDIQVVPGPHRFSVNNSCACSGFETPDIATRTNIPATDLRTWRFIGPSSNLGRGADTPPAGSFSPTAHAAGRTRALHERARRGPTVVADRVSRSAVTSQDVVIELERFYSDGREVSRDAVTSVAVTTGSARTPSLGRASNIS